MLKFLQGRILTTRLFLLLAVLLLIFVGVATIYAVGNPVGSDPTKPSSLADNWVKQVQFAIVGLFAFFAVNMVNYRRLGELSYPIFVIILVLLAYLLAAKFVPLPFAPVINGTRCWIRFSSSLPAIQPSEFCKVAYILALAWYLRYRSNYRSFQSLIGPFALTLLPAAMILLEPDLGTVILMMLILFIMLFAAGARVKHLLIVILLAMLLSPIMWHYMRGDRAYQRLRISSVVLQSPAVRKLATEHPAISQILIGKPHFNTQEWQNGMGYHLIRSKYAIASGGAAGNGYGDGIFLRYNLLPERHNDFIFAAIAHQWGFWGCMAIFGLYCVIFVCGIEIAVNNGDPFGRLLAVGIVAMFAVEVIVNVSMALGLMPITGLTLPLVSYGGSSLLVNIIAVGLLNNVGRCRQFNLSAKGF